MGSPAAHARARFPFLPQQLWKPLRSTFARRGLDLTSLAGVERTLCGTAVGVDFLRCGPAVGAIFLSCWYCISVFLCAWRNAVSLSLESSSRSGGTLQRLRAWQFPLHLLASDSAHPPSLPPSCARAPPSLPPSRARAACHVHRPSALWDNRSSGAALIRDSEGFLECLLASGLRQLAMALDPPKKYCCSAGLVRRSDLLSTHPVAPSGRRARTHAEAFVAQQWPPGVLSRPRAHTEAHPLP